MQIPDTFMVGRTGRDFCQWHNLLRKSPHRAWKLVRLPVLHQRGINADMCNTYPRIMLYGIKKPGDWLASFHGIQLKANLMPAALILFLFSSNLFFDSFFLYLLLSL